MFFGGFSLHFSLFILVVTCPESMVLWGNYSITLLGMGVLRYLTASLSDLSQEQQKSIKKKVKLKLLISKRKLSLLSETQFK